MFCHSMPMRLAEKDKNLQEYTQGEAELKGKEQKDKRLYPSLNGLPNITKTIIKIGFRFMRFPSRDSCDKVYPI